MVLRKTGQSLPEITVRGATAPSSNRWLNIAFGSASGWVRYEIAALDEKTGKAQLAQQGVLLPGPIWREVMSQIAATADFPPLNIAEACGWCGASFVLPDGTIFAPEGENPPLIAFVPDRNKCHQAGSLDGWLEEVAGLILGQTLPTFYVMIAFLGPLLKLVRRPENPGFDLHGGAGGGKSFLGRLLASAMGSPIKGNEQYYLTMDATLDGLEAEMPNHSDMTIVLNEANLFYAGDSEAVRNGKIRALAFRYAEGTEKRRYGGAKAQAFSFAFAMSANKGFGATLKGENHSVAAAAQSRLISLKVPKGQLFDSVPDQYDGSGSFAKALDDGAARNHGYAFRAFIDGLVRARARDEAALLAQISGYVARFRAKAGVDPNDGEKGRIAEAFALVYAGGALAKEYGALPAEVQCGPVVLDCYQRFYGAPKPPEAFSVQLKRYLKQPRTRDLDKKPIREMSPKRFARTPAFFKHNRAGRLEAMVWPPSMDAAIPGWKALLASDSADIKLNAEGHGHDTQRRQVKVGKKVRMLCFELPDGFLD